VKGIQVSLNQGDSHCPRGDDSERVKILIFFLNLVQNQPAKFNQTKTNYPWVKGIQVYSNKGLGPFQRGYNHKNVKMGWFRVKSSPEPLGQA
jgi:hypothetical protein